MKFRTHLFACLLLGASLGVVSSAAAGPRIGVLLKGQTSFWNACAKGVAEAGARLGADVLIKQPPSESDVAIQLALLRALAAQHIQALVIAPTNKDSLAGPVSALAATGVKVVVVDSRLSGDNPFVFVGTDQQAAGEAAGTLLASLVGDTDEVAFLRHNQAGGATQVRERGAFAKLKSAHPNLDIHGEIYASTEVGVEGERSELLLGKYPKAKYVFASGTPGTMAMLKALRSRKGGPRLIGCGFNLNADVVAALQSGSMAGWIAQLPQEIGAKAVEAAVQEVSGQTVPSVISTDFVVVTKDNLDDPKIKALLSL